MKKINYFLFFIKLQYNKISKLKILKIFFKLLHNIIFSLIIYIYMPDMYISNTNLNENDKMIIMACFVVFSGIMSYILNNYQWKPPGSESDIVYNIDINSIGVTGWKRTLLRILLAFR